MLQKTYSVGYEFPRVVVDGRIFGASRDDGCCYHSIGQKDPHDCGFHEFQRRNPVEKLQYKNL